MKVKHLLDALANVDPELEICVFETENNTPMLLNDVNIYDGYHQTESNKMIIVKDIGPYVGLGNPGNYTEHREKFPIQELYPESV